MKIERILIEDQMAPIGLDEKKPAFSWLLTAEEGEQNLMQSACRIVVRTGEDTVWDSGKMETGVSTGIGYEGEALQPCTKYEVKAEVWDNTAEKQKQKVPSRQALWILCMQHGRELSGSAHRMRRYARKTAVFLRSRVNFGWKAGREKRVSSLEPMTSV